LVAVVTVCLLAVTARADDDPPPADEEEPPAKEGKAEKKSKKAPPPDEEGDEPPSKKQPKEEVDEPASSSASASASVSAGEMIEVGAPKGRMTLPGGKFMLNAIVEANMAKKSAFKPFGIAPDLWLGLHDKLTFGIYHSGRAANGFLSGFGNGICLRDVEVMDAINKCQTGISDKYTFVGSEARIGISEGGLALALVLGGQVRAFEPERIIAGKGGFLMRIHAKRLAIELSPTVLIGLTKRKLTGDGTDVLAVPLTIYLRFAPRVALALQTGITSTFKKFGDNYQVPAAAGLQFYLGTHLSVDVAFGLAAVADKNDMTKAFDQRSLTAGLGYAL
jgi:hypothetical protein